MRRPSKMDHHAKCHMLGPDLVRPLSMGFVPWAWLVFISTPSRSLAGRACPQPGKRCDRPRASCLFTFGPGRSAF